MNDEKLQFIISSHLLMQRTKLNHELDRIISPLCNFDQFWNFDIFYLCKYSVLPTSGAMTTCPGFPGYCSESFPGQTCVVVCSKGRNNVPLCQVNNMKIEGYVKLENYYMNNSLHETWYLIWRTITCPYLEHRSTFDRYARNATVLSVN